MGSFLTIIIASLLIIIIVLLLRVMVRLEEITNKLVGIRKDTIKIIFFTITAIRVGGEKGFSTTISDIEKDSMDFIEENRSKWE
jgi:hypothetical protein